MTNKTVTMSREPMLQVPRALLEALFNADSVERHTNIERELRALLAAPVVERQEPYTWMRIDVDGNPYRCNPADHGDAFPLYTSPHAPVAVVLPEREEEEPYWSAELCPDFEDRLEWAEAKGFNQAIDKVKEMNQ